MRYFNKYSKKILLDLHENEDEFTKYAKCTLAIDLYKNKKVSSGILCGYSRRDKSSKDSGE